MNTDNTIIYKLDNSIDTETSLKNTVNNVLTKLKAKFGNEYQVTSDEFGVFDTDWSHDIKVRKGNKIGAEVTFKWEKSQPEIVILEVDDSSKIGALITYTTLLLFVIVGAYLGYNDMAPLAFLPGYKLAAGLGGLIFMIPGLIIVAILKSLFLKNEKEQNTTLIKDIILLIRE